MESKVQYSYDSGKRPLETVKKLIQVAHKEVTKTKKENKTARDFWQDNLSMQALFFNLEEPDAGAIRRARKEIF